MSNSSYLIKFNYNPWKVSTGDCAIRAIVAATGLDYRVVCKKLGVSWKNGKGLIRDSGINLDLIKNKFNNYFDIVEDFTEDLNFVPDEFKNSSENYDLQMFDLKNDIDNISSGITLHEFIEMFDSQGAFLVSLDKNPKATNVHCRNGGHIVYAQCIPNKRVGFVDSWDSSEMLVDAYMRVIKREPKNSPLHWKYDKEKKQFIL